MQYIPQMYFSDKLSRSNHRVTKLLCYFDNNNLCAKLARSLCFKSTVDNSIDMESKVVRFRQVAKNSLKNSCNCKVWWQIWVCITKETLRRGVEYFKTLENWFIVLNLLGCKTPRLCLWIMSNLNLKPFQYDIDTLNLSNEM